MATSSAEDFKTVTSPLDLSLKVGPIANTVKPDDDVNERKSNDDHTQVSSEELLSLKLLHDRLSKTMELLLPQEKLKRVADMKNSETSTSKSNQTTPEFDYRTTMKALLSLVQSEGTPTSEEDGKPFSLLSNKVPLPPADTWPYWHEYILSLYLMNSSTLPPLPSIPPPAIPQATSLFPPPFNFLAPSHNSVLFQTMLNNLLVRSSVKSQNDSSVKNVLLHDNLNQEFGFKNKKLNSYQMLQDSSSLYNSFAATRNMGLAKTKLLDSPESFGVSLRGNQKYSIYYQQRPNNIFNNNFIPPVNSSTLATKFNSNTNYKHSSLNNNPTFGESLSKKLHNSTENCHRKTVAGNSNKLSTSIGKSKFAQEHPKSNYGFENGQCHTADTIPTSVPLSNRQRETVFNCSCGQEFENLYAFTIHMKSTHHSPNSTKVERSIPKLVRGQDMWINSETEQTKEILRCMRCHQSFRTLPELTMHMVETNHYSEIVYSDTGKCVFLNSDSDKIKPSYTTISSPMSSPGEIIRKLKRTVSSSTVSDICVDEEHCKKMRMSSPVESGADVTVDSAGLTIIKDEEILEIKEADSGTVDAQPDCDSYDTVKDKEGLVNSTTLCDSVIRQIEKFVEKSLPKPNLTEYSIAQSVLCNTTPVYKTGRMSNKCNALKSSCVDKSWKTDYRAHVQDKSNSLLKNKERPPDAVAAFSYKNYPISSTDNTENPLSSLQTLVETIQKNTMPPKESNASSCKVSPTQIKELSSYSNPAKSPVVCDSLSQLQALVAGTSGNAGATPSKHNDIKQLGYQLQEKSKLISTNDMLDSSSTFLSWCHKLGELLGLPHALSQAMITQGAIKELTDSVLIMNEDNKSSSQDANLPWKDDDNTTDQISSVSIIKSFHNLETDPIEQLKNFLNSTTDAGALSHSPMLPSKYLNGPNQTTNSPPSISKKVKCHFCNKPFANKGQVRLHISKGKCPSLMRSSHSSCTQMTETLSKRNLSPTNYEYANYQCKDANVTDDTSNRGDEESYSGEHHSTSIDKSTNLIRAYYKFATHMIRNSDLKSCSSTKLDNKIE